jgi:MarR family transcriptional regulator, organic hydroperoxide resistance regulator
LRAACGRDAGRMTPSCLCFILIRGVIPEVAQGSPISGEFEDHHVERRHYSSQLGFKLGAAWRHSGSIYRRHLPEGLSLSQAYVLEALPPKNGIVMGELSEALDMDLPAVSSLVARMERTGLLMREANANNRRQILVRVTAEGSRIRRLTRSCAKRSARRIFSISRG